MIRIRGASTADGPRLVELHAGVQDVHLRHRPDWFVAQPGGEEVRADFEAALGDPHVSVLVAELSSGPAVVGYALARVVKRDSSTEAQARSTVMLEQLGVDPDASRAGVGSALLEAVREIGREAGCQSLVTNVWSFNTPARGFYEASGLVPRTQQLEQNL
ncbi:GNAT family N-acetyltransferase [Streptomyces sp. NPDC057418]|uniref:GNAT family N-acetyltransferase n=1 Tax=Streptomyces sp. NPDC057418 TaxID=3346126 RepID=UPI00368DBF4D